MNPSNVMDPIKKQSVYLKTLFFLFFVALGAGSPYFGIFYKHVIVNADGTPAIGLIGLIFFVMPLVSLIANIPAGILADKFHSGKHLITFLCFGVALFAFLIGLAGEDFARHWGLGGKFIFIFSMLFFLNCCLLPLIPMVDAEALLFLNKHFRRESYGAYRLWGTYGWSIATVLMGALLFYFHHDSLIFYGDGLAFALLGLVSWSGIEARPAAAPIHIPWNHLKKDALFQGFLVFIFLNGVVTNASANYTSYFFDDVMKTPLEIGLILGTWTLFEIPVMMFSRKLIDLFGNRWLIMSGPVVERYPSDSFFFFYPGDAVSLEIGRVAPAGAGVWSHAPRDHRFRRPAGPSGHARHLHEHHERGADVAGIRPGRHYGKLADQAVGKRIPDAVLRIGSIALIFFFVFLVRRHGSREQSA